LDPQGVLKKMKTFGQKQQKFYDMVLERNRQTMRLKDEAEALKNAEKENSMAKNFVHVLLRAQESGEHFLLPRNWTSVNNYCTQLLILETLHCIPYFIVLQCFNCSYSFQ
jgi:hypothetical protein